MNAEGKVGVPAGELSEQGLKALSLVARSEPYDMIGAKLRLRPWQLRALLEETSKALGAQNVDDAIRKAKEQGLI